MAKKAEQTTEIAVVENTKLTELAQKSGIELTKAEAHVSAFHPAFAELSELSRPLATLDKENPTADHARIARENRLKIVKVRTGSESIKDERKKVLLAEGNLIQSAFNLVKDACILTESEYEEIEKAEERREKARLQELKETRIALLLPYETDTEFLPLDIMDEERFQALLSKEKEAFEAVKAKREQDEKDRIEAERRLEEIERLRWERADLIKPYYSFFKDDGTVKLGELSSEEFEAVLSDLKSQFEAEKKRQAERDAENERLKKEAEIREAELAKERAEREKQIETERKEAARIAAGKQAEIDKANAEADRIRKELESKKLAEENERLAKIAEQQEKEAAAKALLKAPDQEKVKAFFVQFTALKFPELQSEAGKAMAIRVNEALAIVKQVIIQDSKTLL